MGDAIATAHGRLRGSVVDGVHAFLGVPYAAPPSGANRLRPPRPVEPWSGERDATRYGPSPPQVAAPEAAGTDWDTALTGEDCLLLNVWTPDPGGAGLPVMVWIQGGAFTISSTASYDGSHFARDGVVCVVINWRVGADGFLYLGDDVANVGLLDQVAALEWVRENIAAFGGDPGNVTVFGESAGAMSIGTLLSMPRAEGLFRRAIPQSGAAHQVSSPTTASRIGRSLAEKLGVPPTREEIAAVPVDRRLAAQTELEAEVFADQERWGPEMVGSSMPWQPVVDGDVVPGPPLERIAAGAGTQVDLLVGTNTDDWRLFLVITGAIDQVTEQDLTAPVTVSGNRSLAAYGLPVESALAAYRSRYPDASPGELLAAVQTDWWVRIPAIRLADAHVNDTSNSYMYEFAWSAPGLGAVHAVEIPFVFDTVSKDARLFGPLLGEDPPQELADTMHAAWVSFATSGDPGWPTYDLGSRATMRFDTTSQVVEDPRTWERALWEGLR
ncbi:carboxylesterase/lipase family protein [Nocardioides sp. WL0053]|uniref:Carboxylic ester hydrolase n=1 Tax=Nocardioides jiangsuensis TaxID=2866161 RepID=A0ABS7RP64_9ACTN|nr:carboxylesterase/lipase family protein [Nocardioides jiangsuensis]MBY9076835.1 carboxylesterase/lipase family protein [Nocardioides jiangsuensis]